MQKINSKLFGSPMSKREAKKYSLDSKYALYADHLSCIFEEGSQSESPVFYDLNIKFEKGQIYFIIGDSGAGKSTLVNHFNGLLKSKHGNIFVEKSKILGAKNKISKIKKLRKSVGMVFQFPEYQLFKDTILKDVMFGPVNLGVRKDAAKRLAEKYILQMGLDESFYKRSPFELSGGQKRRVAIAGILAIEPNILVFDEPTAGLDPVGMREMLDLIGSLKQQGKTVFVITHDMNHVLEMADKILLLGKQKVLAFDEPYNIFYNDIIKETSIIKPRIIQTIDALIKINPKFKKLIDLKPRNISDLAIGINSILKGGKNA